MPHRSIEDSGAALATLQRITQKAGVSQPPRQSHAEGSQPSTGAGQNFPMSLSYVTSTVMADPTKATGDYFGSHIGGLNAPIETWTDHASDVGVYGAELNANAGGSGLSIRRVSRAETELPNPGSSLNQRRQKLPSGAHVIKEVRMRAKAGGLLGGQLRDTSAMGHLEASHQRLNVADSVGDLRTRLAAQRGKLWEQRSVDTNEPPKPIDVGR